MTKKFKKNFANVLFAAFTTTASFSPASYGMETEFENQSPRNSESISHFSETSEIEEGPHYSIEILSCKEALENFMKLGPNSFSKNDESFQFSGQKLRELIRDQAIASLDGNFTIVDFGCGKADFIINLAVYLSSLEKLQKKRIQIYGVDWGQLNYTTNKGMGGAYEERIENKKTFSINASLNVTITFLSAIDLQELETTQFGKSILGKVDYGICTSVLPIFKDPFTVMIQMRNTLKPKGQLFFQSPMNYDDRPTTIWQSDIMKILYAMGENGDKFGISPDLTFPGIVYTILESSGNFISEREIPYSYGGSVYLLKLVGSDVPKKLEKKALYFFASFLNKTQHNFRCVGPGIIVHQHMLNL